MADVRLTATNPEDSSVVPVACNEKGELKLEEPIIAEGPPGPPGEQGPPGQDGAPGKDGDPFSGDFTGDVYFDGDVGIGATPAGASLDVRGGHLYVMSPGKTPWQSDETSQNSGIVLTQDGRINAYRLSNNSNFPLQFLTVDATTGIQSTDFVLTTGGNVGIGIERPSTQFSVRDKAGFTKEGYLWCTTRRGDTVILDFTSNGMGMWEPYTPRIGELADGVGELADEIRDKLENGSTTDIDSLRPKGD